MTVLLLDVVSSEKCEPSELLIVGRSRLPKIVHQVNCIADCAVVSAPPVSDELERVTSVSSDEHATRSRPHQVVGANLRAEFLHRLVEEVGRRFSE